MKNIFLQIRWPTRIMLSWLPCSQTSEAGMRYKKVTPRFTTIHIINTIMGRPLQPIRTRASTWCRRGPTPRRWLPGVTRKTLTTWWVTIRTRGTITRGTDSRHLHMTATKKIQNKKEHKQPRQEFYLTFISILVLYYVLPLVGNLNRKF